MLVNMSRQGNLLTFFGANRLRESNLGQIFSHRLHVATSCCRADINHENFALGQLLDLGLLSTIVGISYAFDRFRIQGELCHWNISTNAGEQSYFRFWTLHANVLGLEVVLASGIILNSLNTVVPM
jgi:hypothetical protein